MFIFRNVPNKYVTIAAGICLSFSSNIFSAACDADFPEPPSYTSHYELSDILSGRYTVKQIYEHGRLLFSLKPNICDGLGRPATTGTGVKRQTNQINFIRTSGPDSNACGGCHNEPTIGGAGDFVSNVFVLAQAQDPVIDTISPEFSNERNTLGMYGSGAIELLAIEMSEELREQAVRLSDGLHTLTTKGISFAIRKENGSVVWSEGVDTDLIIKPFHQSGVVVSLREFSVNAMNHHHGIQPEERFDLNPAKGFDPDFDEDGVPRELTLGDISAITLFQALLPIPQQIIPSSNELKLAVEKGERLFSSIGCADCHTTSLTLNSTLYSDVNPFNPPGTFNDTTKKITVDLTKVGPPPRLKATGNKPVVVHAYTDLKRHNLCDSDNDVDGITYFCNEYLDQGRPSHDGSSGSEYFLTRKLWDVGSSAPYGHRGDISTLTEAILYHGGEARLARDTFASLTKDEKISIISFLNSLKAPDSIEFPGNN